MDPFEGLLEEVLGLVSTARHVTQIPQHAVSIAAEKLAKRRRITLEVSGDQILI